MYETYKDTTEKAEQVYEFDAMNISFSFLTYLSIISSPIIYMLMDR